MYLHGLLAATPTASELDRLVVSSGDFGLAYLRERWAARFVSELFRNYTVFRRLLKVVATLPEDPRSDPLARLDAVRDVSHNLGYGVGEDMDALLSECGIDD